MKIIISPAKKLCDLTPTNNSINYYDQSTTLEILEIIKSKQSNFIEVFKCSDEIAQTAIKYYEQFGKETFKAGQLYNGMVFNQLQQSDWDETSKSYFNNNVIILDALYGMIKPTDYISKYRLDFLAKLGTNLYKKWNIKINDELIVNLASEEYSKMISEKMFNISFVQIKNNKEVAQSTECKKMRGIYLNWLVSNNITDKDEMLTFNLCGYVGNIVDNGIKFIKAN